jgi:hypothetical protein
LHCRPHFGHFGLATSHVSWPRFERCRAPAGAHVKKESNKVVRIELNEEQKKKDREQPESDLNSVDLKVDQELEHRITPSIGTFF